MAMRSIFTQAHVTDDEDLREVLLDELDRLDDRAFWIVGGCSQCIFGIRGEGHPEKNDRFESLSNQGRQKRN